MGQTLPPNGTGHDRVSGGRDEIAGARPARHRRPAPAPGHDGRASLTGVVSTSVAMSGPLVASGGPPPGSASAPATVTEPGSGGTRSTRKPVSAYAIATRGLM